MGFDLTEADNLTEADKAELIRLVGEEYGMETLTGTMDELTRRAIST